MNVQGDHSSMDSFLEEITKGNDLSNVEDVITTKKKKMKTMIQRLRLYISRLLD
ncbi:hypothetical protein [Geomicrobium sp. JCM 19055]|uniref:hypothetical protein n=1 Tax=Geomicrobium sp. JCM 19055 TaxID=1460649 RepID=UPI00045ED6EA|nr:hypothetical protein [Geomicrobium sp. JCM 19055]GAK01626.1 hypothetical protein JCM19055_4808 [Geomicrobium sp. JCM 19055]